MFTGPDQVRPTDFCTALKNTKFKSALVNFMMNQWGRNEAANIISEKKFMCYLIRNLNTLRQMES